MKKNIIFLLVLTFFIIGLNAQVDSLIIQESDLGLCTYDGKIVTSSSSISGWTGPGFIDAESGIGVAISWEIFVQNEGDYLLTWRYAFGGTSTNLRDSKLLVDGNIAVDTVYFPYTGSWSAWREIEPVQVHLTEGDHKIRLVSVRTSGLANIDYIKIYGNSVTAYECTPQYTLSVESNDSVRGTVLYSPVQDLYDKGTVITLHASANPGYFFQSWLGEEPSSDSIFSFPIKCNVHAIARFLPNSILSKIDTTIIGYATVQDDNGTPFLMTGGAEGDTVQATTLTELKTYLGSSTPYVVKFSGKLIDSAEIAVKSDKTLLGVGEIAHLQGIELSVNQARNVIIRNIAISHVHPKDAVEINGGSRNIVIDHCEFFSDREHGTDYYDGLLDIKNQSSFITVSRCAFHDHYKTILISSGDEQYGDTVIRVTFHHNYFFNCESRLPSIRFGKAHIFNNYYKNCNTAVNTRMGACVRVEKNYFDNVNTAVMSEYSTVSGQVQMIDNYFGTSNYITEPVCELSVPYQYLNYVNQVENLPLIVPGQVLITGVGSYKQSQPYEFSIEQNYPNPFNPSTIICYSLPRRANVSIKVYNALGREVTTVLNEIQNEGIHQVEFRAGNLSSGTYFIVIKANNQSIAKKAVLVR